MPSLVDFRGRLTLSFIKKLTISYCPLYSRSMNNKALSFWRKSTSRQARITNKDCVVELNATWNYESPSIDVVYVNDFKYRPPLNLSSNQIADLVMDRRLLVEEEMRRKGLDVPQDDFNRAAVTLPLVPKTKKKKPGGKK
eukprot:RCo044631